MLLLLFVLFDVLLKRLFCYKIVLCLHFCLFGYFVIHCFLVVFVAVGVLPPPFGREFVAHTRKNI